MEFVLGVTFVSMAIVIAYQATVIREAHQSLRALAEDAICASRATDAMQFAHARAINRSVDNPVPMEVAGGAPPPEVYTTPDGRPLQVLKPLGG